MLTVLFMGIIAAVSQNVIAQFPDFTPYNYDESVDDYSNEENVDPYVYDDNAWFELQYKLQHLLNNEDYEEEDLARLENARGIPEPTSNKVIMCTEKLHGPFPTIDEINLPHEHIYPSIYYNISCVEDNLHHHGHHRTMPIRCEAHRKHKCSTTTKQVPVFRKRGNNHNKECWKMERSIPVETGCKCVHSNINEI